MKRRGGIIVICQEGISCIQRTYDSQIGGVLRAKVSKINLEESSKCAVDSFEWLS